MADDLLGNVIARRAGVHSNRFRDSCSTAVCGLFCLRTEIRSSFKFRGLREKGKCCCGRVKDDESGDDEGNKVASVK